jgi:hypothetical protein
MYSETFYLINVFIDVLLIRYDDQAVYAGRLLPYPRFSPPPGSQCERESRSQGRFAIQGIGSLDMEG